MTKQRDVSTDNDVEEVAIEFDEDATYSCNFCGATNKDESTLCLITAPDKTFICDSCVAIAEAMVAEKITDEIDLFRIPGLQKSDQEKKLRPVTRIPKKWLINEVDLYRKKPTVTACSRDGKKHETFSLPKPLAHWMIAASREEFDLEEIKEEIREELISKIRWDLSEY